MPRILLAAAAVAAAVTLSPSNASAVLCTTADLSTCVDAACARPYEEGCRQVDRCYHFTDYQTCIYPTVGEVCFYPVEGRVCLPWHVS